MIASKLLLAVYFSTILIPLAVAILLNVKQKEMVKKHDFKNHVFADHKQELRLNKKQMLCPGHGHGADGGLLCHWGMVFAGNRTPRLWNGFRANKTLSITATL